MTKYKGSSLPIKFKRLGKGPIDVDSVFDSMDEAVAYLKSGISYPGQPITIKISGKWKLFLVNDENKLEEYITGGSSSGSTPTPTPPIKLPKMVFDSLTVAEEFAKGTQSIIGSAITVKEKSEWKLYIIQDDRTLKEYCSFKPQPPTKQTNYININEADKAVKEGKFKDGDIITVKKDGNWSIYTIDNKTMKEYKNVTEIIKHEDVKCKEFIYESLDLAQNALNKGELKEGQTLSIKVENKWKIFIINNNKKIEEYSAVEIHADIDTKKVIDSLTWTIE